MLVTRRRKKITFEKKNSDFSRCVGTRTVYESVEDNSLVAAVFTGETKRFVLFRR